jgi:hypothetical protein
MVDERIALLEEMYNRICERESGPADPALQGVVSTWLAKNLEGILIKRSGGPQWLLITRSYV